MGIRKASNKDLVKRMRTQIMRIHRTRLAVDKVQAKVNVGRKEMDAMYQELATLEDKLRNLKEYNYYRDDLIKLNGLRRKLFV